MQFLGHVIVNKQKTKVLVRTKKTYVSLKLRESGVDGTFLSDESIYLTQEPEQERLLKSGKVIKC